LTISRTRITNLLPVTPHIVITLSIIIAVALVGSFVAEKRRAGISRKILHTPEVTKTDLLTVAEISVITVQVRSAVIVTELPRILGDS
jgi:hypothetical protein